MTMYVANTGVLDLLGLKSHVEDIFLNDATVTFTIKDKAGVAVAGSTWPQTMGYIAGSSGDYRGILPAALEMLANKPYTAFIDALGGGERIGHWRMPFTPIIRTGLPEGVASA